MRSPDGSKVAHVGWIMHFAPPWVQSHYLQIGDTVIYPLPQGERPVTLTQLDMPPEVVTHRGLVYEGVHEFRGKFVWSPDSRYVGFIDCMTDYRTRDELDLHGKPENTRCSAVVVALDGRNRRMPFPDTRDIALRWTDGLVAVANGKSTAVPPPQ